MKKSSSVNEESISPHLRMAVGRSIIREHIKMKTLTIKWQRLLSEGETCPRCGLTEKEVDKAVSMLIKSLAPLRIEVKLEKAELSVAEFKENPLQSNRIWIGKRPLEDWIEGKVDKSPCCDVCGPSECRTLEVKGKVYESIPADVIVQAGFLAAAEIMKEPAGTSCREPKKSPQGKSCCPK
ncbi:MAG: DUF2703 domain-containing protein [Candidatus Omnitrophota bacterium]